MKKINILYGLSIIMLFSSIFIIIEYPNWQRIQLISGVFITVGFAINFIAFLLKK